LSNGKFDLGSGYSLTSELDPQFHINLTKDNETIWQSSYQNVTDANPIMLGNELREANILPPQITFENKNILELTLTVKQEMLEKAEADPLPFFDEVLEKTVKYDKMHRRLVLLGQISAYGPNPLNIALKGESSTGKSWVMLETSKFLPSEDVIIYSDASPTSFFWKHSQIKCKEHGEKCPEGCRAEKYKELHLGNKILIMLDQPSDLLLQHLKPLLSHDQKNIIRLTTDPNKKGSTKALEVKIVGWPALQYASCQQATDPEIASRLFLISPSDSIEKVGEVIHFTIGKEKNAYAWRQKYDSDLKVQTAKQIIKELKEFRAKYETVEIEKPYLDVFEEIFNEKFPKSPRTMRTLPQFLSLIDAVTLLHHKHREQRIEDKTLILTSTKEDGEAAFKIIEYFYESLKYGLPTTTLDFYNTVMIPLIKENGPANRKDIVQKYCKVKDRPLGERWIVQYYLKPLAEKGLLFESTDPVDKRRTLYTLGELETNVTEGSPLLPQTLDNINNNSISKQPPPLSYISFQSREDPQQ